MRGSFSFGLPNPPAPSMGGPCGEPRLSAGALFFASSARSSETPDAKIILWPYTDKMRC